ncbi:MAG: FtsH protease activity modulator HflK [Candidatus Omnitrophota bacterium]
MDFEKPDDVIYGTGGKQQLIPPQYRKYIPIAVTAVILLAVLFLRDLSVFYSVGPDEVGVVRRFGEYVRTSQPGLRFKLPIGLEKVNLVKVKYIFKEEFGFHTTKAGIISQRSAKDYLSESRMLTGDLNVIIVEWIVQFKIKDPVKLLFNIRDPRDTIRKISEAVMRQVVGDNSVTEILTTRRVELNQEVQDKLQQVLDSYDCGVHIVTVKLQDVNPPDPVKPSFNEVNEAKQEREKMINEAWEAYNKAIPLARGEAEKTITESEGYALNRVNKAKGDAAKFTATWNAYKNAKEVTRKRLFLEAMNDVLPKAGVKYIIDSQQKGILPLMRLDKEGGVQ